MTVVRAAVATTLWKTMTMNSLPETSKERLAALMVKLAIRKAQILANPEPVLDEMSAAITELQKTLLAVEDALSPKTIARFWSENCDHSVIRDPGDIQGEALIRIAAAQKVLRGWRYGEDDGN